MPQGNVRVKITADTKDLERGTRRAEKSLGGLSSKAKSFASSATGVSLALGGVAGVGFALKSVTDAAIEAEKSQARLDAQLNAVGDSSQQTKRQIDGVIQSQSQMSGFDDESLSDSFVNIVRVTKDVDQALRLNNLAMDLARAKQIDVAKAGELVGKVAGGNTGILARYGIQLDKGATATEALAEVQRRVSGQAAEYGKTTAGSLDRLSVASENARERLGQALAPAITTVANGVAKFVTEMQDGTGAGGEFADTAERIAGDVGDVVEVVGRFVEKHPQIVKVGLAMAAVGTAVNAIKFASKITGLSTFLSAATRGASLFKGIWAKAGVDAGAEASAKTAEALKDNLPASVRARRGSIRGAGRIAGGIFGAAAAAAILLAVDDALSDLLDPDGTVQRFNDDVNRRQADKGGIAGFVQKLENARQGTADWLNPLDGKARGGAVTSPMVMVGEEAPQHPEWVIATNPAYRRKNIGHWVDAGRDLGIDGFADGGMVGGRDLRGATKRMGGSGGTDAPSSVPKRSKGIVALGRWLQSNGYQVSEHPAFGGVDPVHTPGSWHYRAGAVDVNADGRRGGEAKWLDRVDAQLEKAGWHTIWRAPGHYDHLHVDLGSGGGGSEDRESPDSKQRIAATIYSVGKRMGASHQAILAAIEAALVESGLQNLNYGDRDSVGVFQQRPSQGWGTKQQIMDPEYAATKFFEKAIPLSKGFTGTAGQLAQSVQRSAFPGRYDERRDEALGVIGELAGGGVEFATTKEADKRDRNAERDRDNEANYQSAVLGKLAAPIYAAAKKGAASRGLTPHRRGVWARRVKRAKKNLIAARLKVDKTQRAERRERLQGEPNYDLAYQVAETTPSYADESMVRTSAIQYWDAQIRRGQRGELAPDAFSRALSERQRWGTVETVGNPYVTDTPTGDSGPSQADLLKEQNDLLKELRDGMKASQARWAAVDGAQGEYRSLARALALVTSAELGGSAGMGSLTPSSAGSYSRY